MRLLAIETATMLGGVAVLDDETLVAETRMNIKVAHSERIVAEMHGALGSAGLGIEDIDVFALSIGPGSFTGLRVGLSTIKGLAYATGRRVVAVPTLEALAWNVPFSRHPVCPVLDARKKEVYAGIFRWSGDGFIRDLCEQAVRMVDLLAGIKEPTIFLGEGALLYREAILSAIGDMAVFAQPQDMVPSPSNVAFLGMGRAKRGEFEDPVSLVPAYLRKSEAETKTR